MTTIRDTSAARRSDGQYLLNGDGSYSFNGALTTTAPVTTSTYSRTSPIRESHYANESNVAYRTSPIRESHYATESNVAYRTSPIRESHYANESNVTYTTISDNTLNVKPREYETTRSPIRESHYENEGRVTYTTLADETLNAQAREFETTNVTQSTFEPRVTYTTISDETLNAKPRTYETESRVTVVQPQVDISEYERRIRQLESEISLLRSRKPEVVDRVVEKRVEIPYPVDRVIEKRVEIPVEHIVEHVVEKRVEVPVERIVERIVEKRVEVPVERIVEKIVEKRVEVPVERVVEKIVEVEKKPRDLSGLNPFVGFGLVESDATKNKGSLPVETIYEHGPAWDAGMRLDDDISEIGRSGQPINNLNQVRDTIMREAKVGQPLRVVGKRPNGERYETSIDVKTTNAKATQQGWNDIYYDNRAHQKLGHSTTNTVVAHKQ